jgi:NAD(P)-dependent dehydrogenase (short-subunit alcohol dehydrogenase family)
MSATTAATATPGTRPAALVTGAARRLGRAIAVELARRGWDLALHYLSSRAEVDAVAAEVAALGARTALLPADLAAAESPGALVRSAAAAFPGLCLLVNNASIFEPGSLAETTPDLFDRNFAIHVRMPFFLTRELAAVTAASGREAQVINLLDTRITRDVTDHFAYTLSKKSLADLTRLSARALAPRVRVNGVAPGVILPPPGAPDGYLERRAATLPLARVGDVEGIVRAVAYLLDSPFVTGEVLFVDGGEHLL